VLILLITRTYSRNRIWNSDIELWTDCVKKSPNKDRPHNNLGNAYLMMGNRSLALREYEILKAMNSSLANTLYQKIK